MANLRIRDDVFDPPRPQLLLYMPKRSGGYRLAGIGYTFVHNSHIPAQCLGDARPESGGLPSQVWRVPEADGVAAPRVDLEDQPERCVH